MPSHLDPVPDSATHVASPCISVCRMNPSTQLCEGCARTIDEIANWSRYSDTEKRSVLRRISERRRLA